MQIELKPIAEYRKEYKVYALFEGTDRRFADIVRNEHAEAPIDAYIIMINPGSCHKKSDDNPLKDTTFYNGFDMVEAVSDPAQKCIMALMDACNMNKIRILNLFDYANGNLVEALKHKGVSIFDNSRAEDRKKYMPTDAVCIAAWGMDSSLMEYKKMAYECIGGECIIGYPENLDKYEYRYIKPRGQEAQKTVISRIADEYIAYKARCGCEFDALCNMFPKVSREDIVAIWNYIVDASRKMDDPDAGKISMNCS